MRISRWGGAAILGAAVALALAAPAAAQGEHFPAAGWQVRQIGTGETAWSPAAASQVVDASTVDLTKPDGTTGTSIETSHLGMDVNAGDVISVSYELLDDALTDAGAVRLFYYDTRDADTLATAPTAFVAADGSGVLELTVAATDRIGTLGLVYDASNDSAGTVRFTDLTVAGTPILFVAPPEPSPSPTGQPTPGPTGEPTPDPTKPADPSPSDPAGGAGGGSDKPGLPVTGSSLPVLVGGGAVLAAGGGGIYWLTRRRGVSFTA